MSEEGMNIKQVLARFTRTSTWLPFILFLALLSIPYIYLSHRSDNNLRKIEALTRENKELRAEYITIKSELMKSIRQSEVANRLKEKGIELPTNAPEKIVIE